MRSLVEETKRILRIHTLPCANAVQLASAVLAAERIPSALQFITLDEQLLIAASKEGFQIVNIA